MVSTLAPSETVLRVPGTLRHSFEHQLAELQDDILRMGSFVVEMLGVAVQALVRQETELAEHVIQMDDTADQMEQLDNGEFRLIDRPERLPHSYTLRAVKG